MTYTDRIIETVEATLDGRIVSRRYTQVVELNNEGEVVKELSSRIHLENIEIDDPKRDEKIIGLKAKLVGSLNIQQESKIRSTELQRDQKAGECVEHEKVIAALESRILELESQIPEKEIVNVRR